MPDLADGESIEMQGSGAKPYLIKNSGGVYSCSCPAWRNQSNAIEQRTCKHIRKLRGDAEEEARIGGALPQKPVKKTADGEEVTGPPVLLAESWDNAMDLSGWWMSEKLDGVRAYWDGQQFLSRQGNLYHAPDWFIEGLPSEPLDGELWIARKAFQRTVGVVRRQDKTDLWKEVKFLVFDAPSLSDPFEERQKYLADRFQTWNLKFAEPLGQTLCRSVDHLREELARIEALGGEGLMLRQPGSKYVAGRSTTLYKVKTFHDAEAVVVGHEPGRGKHEGRLGAVVVKLPSGKQFSVGTGFSDKQRGTPPTIGSTITFRYQELSDAGIPRFPSFVRLHTETISVPQGEADTPAPPVKSSKKTSTPQAAAPTAQPEATTAEPAPGSGESLPKRLFECTEDGASKFWEIGLVGADLTTRWGKIGTSGQEKTKSFATPEKARAEYDKLVAEKTEKGYEEVDRLNLPPFPPLEWDEYFWVAPIRLPSWAGFQNRGGPYGASSSSKADGTMRLSIATVDMAEPSPAQIAAMRYLLGHEAEIFAAVSQAIVDQIPEIKDDYGDWYTDETGKPFPNVKDANGLKKLMGVSTLHVLNDGEDGEASIGFEFECDWDAEHGLGVLTHHGRVIEVGSADVSF